MLLELERTCSEHDRRRDAFLKKMVAEEPAGCRLWKDIVEGEVPSAKLS